MRQATYHSPGGNAVLCDILTSQDDQMGEIVDLALPGSTTPIVTGVTLTAAPAIGCAVLLGPPSAPKPRKKKTAAEEPPVEDPASPVPEELPAGDPAPPLEAPEDSPPLPFHNS